MNFVIYFFIFSLVLAVAINVGAFIAEKVNKKKLEKFAKENKQ